MSRAQAAPLITLALALASVACGQATSNSAAASNPGSATAAAQASADWPSFEAPQPQAAEPRKQLPGACQLVTAEAAQELLQQPVSPMSDEPENCLWASAGSPGQFTLLTVTLLHNDDLAMAQQVYGGLTGLQGDLSTTVNAQLRQKSRKSGQELEHLGDEAWLSGSNMDVIASRQLLVRKGLVIFNLNITGMSKNNRLEGFDERLIALTRAVVPQL